MNKTVFTILLSLAAQFSWAAVAEHSEGELTCPIPEPEVYRPALAIVIDDLGYSMQAAYDLFELDAKLTFSIIPFTPFAKRMAVLAAEQSLEVMVHAPMETLAQRPWESALLSSMDEQELKQMSKQMLDAVPYARGLNNHGGSLLTQRYQHMAWLMDVLADHQFYFVDSKTTADSIATRQASKQGILFHTRDIFLDNERDKGAIERQLEKAEKIAQQQGLALAIGHPHPQTLEVLKEQLPQLAERGVFLVSVSELLTMAKYRTSYARQTTQASH